MRSDCLSIAPSNHFHRIAARLSPPNSFPLMMKKALANTHCAKLTTSGDWTCFASIAEEHYEGPTSQPWTESTTSNISLAQSARPSSARKTATTSTLGRFTVIITTRRSSRNDAPAARRLSSSSLSRSSEAVKTSTGTLNAT